MTAQELKYSILQLAIQGKLVKQDQNDEPTSVLLEKIKEEREKLIKEKKIKREKYSEIYQDSSDNHYYEKFEDGTVNDITEEIPFDIPESWRFIRFNNLINYKMGKTPTRGEKIFWNNDYNWVSISDMIDGKTIKETKEMVSQKAYDKVFNTDISPKGTLLMSFKLTIGKVSILDMDSFHNEAIISIYPYFDKNNILRNYLFKVLPLISNYGNTKNAIKGKTLNSKSINNLIIPISNLDELTRITSKINFLEPILEKYNSKFLKLETLNNNYKDKLKKSILQYAIQGKLVNQDSNDEPAEALINKILDEKRELIKRKQIKKENLSVIYKDSTDNQFYEKFDDGTISNITDEIPFEIPNNWCWTRLRNITSIKGGKRLPVGSKFSNATTNHIYIRVTDMQNQTILDNDIQYISDNIYEKIKKYTISQDDLYIVIVGSTIGKVGKVPSKFNNMNLTENAAKLVFNKMDKDYLLVILQSDFVQNQLVDKTKQVGVPKLALTRLGNTLICYPPLEEQRRIVNKLNQISNYIKTAE